MPMKVNWTVDPETGCWVWFGRLLKGYGSASKGRLAHRVLYELHVGPIPKGMELDHLCRNPPCVNPQHMEPVTRAENMRRRAEALTHCKQGHEFTPQNTYYRRTGGRACKTCVRIAGDRYNRERRKGRGGRK